MKPELKLDWCSHDAAKYAVEKWHYSKTMPVTKTAKLGVWEGGEFRGVAIFTSGAAGVRWIGKTFGMPQQSVCELQRVALRNHAWEVSRIIAIAVRIMKKSFGGLRLVVSYADPHQGHDGGIYKAGGWIYVGRSSATPDYFHKVTGKKIHSRSITASGVVRVFGQLKNQYKTEDVRMVPREGKLKYFMPLDDEIRSRVELLRRPYPKRVRSVASDTPINQIGKGGAIPTRTLSNVAD